MPVIDSKLYFNLEENYKNVMIQIILSKLILINWSLGVASSREINLQLFYEIVSSLPKILNKPPSYYYYSAFQ